MVIPSRASSGHYLRLSAPSDSIESSLGSPLSEPTIDHSSEPLPASTPTPLTFKAQNSGSLFGLVPVLEAPPRLLPHYIILELALLCLSDGV